MNESLTWLGVALIAVMNVRLGFEISTMGVLRRGSRPRSARGVALAVGVGLAGLILVTAVNGRLQLTFLQATVLASSVFVGYLWARKGYGLAVPPEERSAYLNRRVHAVKEIVGRHGWDVSTPDAVNALADADRLHFDEVDLDILVRLDGEREQEFGGPDRLLLTPDGRPDFDRSCARRIVSLANALGGLPGLPGVVARFEEQYAAGLPGLDYEALRRLRLLADGLIRQWGLDGLFRS